MQWIFIRKSVTRLGNYNTAMGWKASQKQPVILDWYYISAVRRKTVFMLVVVLCHEQACTVREMNRWLWCSCTSSKGKTLGNLVWYCCEMKGTGSVRVGFWIKCEIFESNDTLLIDLIAGLGRILRPFSLEKFSIVYLFVGENYNTNFDLSRRWSVWEKK